MHSSPGLCVEEKPHQGVLETTILLRISLSFAFALGRLLTTARSLSIDLQAMI